MGERVARFLRDRYPHKTADFVAADLEISSSTVRKWLDKTNVPSGAHVWLIIYAYQAEFLAAVIPGLSFIETVIALGRRETAARQQAEAQAQLDALTSRRMP